MTISIESFITPFTEFAFMRKALAACAILSIGGTPLGMFLILRRMALVGDAMSHAILPGVAVAFLVTGLSVWPMTLGGFAAGVVVALLAAFLSRFTQLKEDTSFTLSYLTSIALGMVLVSLKGSGADLLHLLFGNVLAIDNEALRLITGVACLTLFALCVFYRSFVIECFDPDFLSAAKRGGLVRPLFFVLLVINLVAAFQALGTLMALGVMLLPAITAGFWTRRIGRGIFLSILFALAASYTGLLLSYHANLPAGPAVVLTASAFTFLSVLFGRYGSLRSYVFE